MLALDDSGLLQARIGGLHLGVAHPVGVVAQPLQVVQFGGQPLILVINLVLPQDADEEIGHVACISPLVGQPVALALQLSHFLGGQPVNVKLYPQRVQALHVVSDVSIDLVNTLLFRRDLLARFTEEVGDVNRPAGLPLGSHRLRRLGQIRHLGVG